ncbi:MAG: fumarylacetoacetate hydrolase family protein [Candidatus Thorarchaeota archaeon]|jgi:acylpyruvate hydrolase
MRLFTYSRLGVSSIGAEVEGGILDLPDAARFFGSTFLTNGQRFPTSMKDLLTWESGIDAVRSMVERFENLPVLERPLVFPTHSVKILAPISRPGKIVALGLNYKEHIEETGRETPGFPVIFAKFPSCIVNPDDVIPMPKVSDKLDWEVELAVVIGKTCKDVDEDSALDYVAGYTIINDVSARDLQRDDGQWIRGKSLDGLGPLGPCIVTVDELGDGSNLTMQTKINGVVKQDSTTSLLRYGVRQLISHLSQSFTLEPADIIATGTPSGVGFARDPPEYLKPGDEMELYIEKIGYLRNRIIPSK